ncbi:MAG: DUF2318 domain-containing protein [Thermodesulfobacteriota bacterium]
MKVSLRMFLLAGFLVAFVFACSSSESDAGFFGSGDKVLKPVAGQLQIPLAAVSDGKAHHYQVKADDGTMVTFFVLKSRDGVIRAAIDACDVCYKAGKGYFQEGDFMVCENCGMKFASNRINVVKGGCNPAPLNRIVKGDKLIIEMKDINANKWYMKYRLK